MWFHLSAWAQANQQRLFEDEQEEPEAGGVIGTIDVPGCYVATTRWWPPFRDHHDGDRP
jgi:hypothetical protein